MIDKVLIYFKKQSKIKYFLWRSIRNILVLSISASTFLMLILVSSAIWLSDHEEKHLNKNYTTLLESYFSPSPEYKTSITSLSLQYSKEKRLIIKSSAGVSHNNIKDPFLKIGSFNIDTSLKNFFYDFTIPVNIEISDTELNLDLAKSNIEANKPHQANNSTEIYKSVKNKARLFTYRKPIFFRSFNIKNSRIIRNDTAYVLNQTGISKNTNTTITTNISGESHSSSLLTNIINDDAGLKLQGKVASLPTWLLVYAISPEYSAQIQKHLHDHSAIDGDIYFAYSDGEYKVSLDLKNSNTQEDNLFKDFRIKANNNINSSELQLQTLHLSTNNGETVNATASLDVSTGLEVTKLNAKIENGSTDNLLNLWPLNKNIQTRRWIKESLSGGKYNASIKLDSSNTQYTPIATVKFSDISLNYSPKFDQITNIDGGIKFYRDQIQINIDKGTLISSSVSGKAVIYLQEKDMPLSILVDSQGDLKNYINFLGANTIAELENKNIDIKNINGTADSQVNLLLPLSDPSNIKIDVQSKISEASTSAFGKLQLEKGELDLNIANNLMSLEGSAKINTQPCILQIMHYLNNSTDSSFNTKVLVKTSISEQNEFSKLFADKFVVENGEMLSNFEYILSNTNEKIVAEFDIENAKFLLPDIGLTKEKGEKSNLNFELVRTKDSNWKTELFNLTSPQIDIKSFIEITPDFSKILQFNADTNYHGNEFNIRYASTDEKTTTKIRGNEIKLDNATFLNLDNIGIYNNPKAISRHEGKDSSTTVQIDKLIMKNNVVFSNIVGNFDCIKGNCSNSGFAMKINDSDDLTITLKEDGEQNTWLFKTNNAANFLKGLGLYQDIEGGALEAKLHYTNTGNLDKNSPPIMVGKIHLDNFKAVKTPVITKLIVLSPFTAIKNGLEKDALIPFQHMEIPFVYANNKIEINRAYAVGKLMSVGIDGSVDRNESKIKLNGLVVPKSKINTALAGLRGKHASVPEKQGLVSNNFSVTGTLQDPSVKINPIGATLSLLIRLSPIGLF